MLAGGFCLCRLVRNHSFVRRQLHCYNVWLVIDEMNGFSCQSASYAAISNNNNNIAGAITKQFIIKFDAMHHMLTDLR